jgi:hypothetical protein
MVLKSIPGDWRGFFFFIIGLPRFVSHDVSFFDFQVITYILLLRMLVGEPLCPS